MIYCLAYDHNQVIRDHLPIQYRDTVEFILTYSLTS